MSEGTQSKRDADDRGPLEVPGGRGMKEDELRARADCGLCGNPIGKSRVPVFYVVKIERFGLRHDALMRQSGLEQLLGAAAPLARVVGPDEDLATSVMTPVVLTVCEDCSMRDTLLVMMVEKGTAVA